MSAIFVEKDRSEIEADLLRWAECEPTTQFAWKDRKEPKQRARKRQLCIDTMKRFEEVFEGPNRPKSRQEAIEQIYPHGIGYLLMWLVFRELVERIVAWLYDRTQA